MDRDRLDLGLGSLSGAGFDEYRRYSRQRRTYLDDDLVPTRESYLGSQGTSTRVERRSGTDLDRRMESLLQQRALQQQLSIRESQLALANSLLQQQQQQQQQLQQQQFFNKRRMEPSRGRRDSRDDYKRPRLDNRSRPRHRSTGNRDSRDDGRGSRGSYDSRRNESGSRHRREPSDKKSQGSKERYDPEKPTVEDEGKSQEKEKDKEKDKDKEELWFCKVCCLEFKDQEERDQHMSSTTHKEKVAEAAMKIDQSSENGKGHCTICDIELSTSFPQHVRQIFHKKRKSQVLNGCRWCKVTTFNNFTEVLAHRDTAEHIKNQKAFEEEEGDNKRKRRRGQRGPNRGRGKTTSQPKKREPIRVVMPEELKKFDSKVATGKACVVEVTGWFCKLCNKFYNTETAKDNHCFTEPHFDNYKRLVYKKLRAKAEEERDAKEKAEEEERKKKEEEAEGKEKKEEGGEEKAEVGEGGEEEGEEPGKDGGEGDKDVSEHQEDEENAMEGDEEETGMEEEEEGYAGEEETGGDGDEIEVEGDEETGVGEDEGDMGEEEIVAEKKAEEEGDGEEMPEGEESVDVQQTEESSEDLVETVDVEMEESGTGEETAAAEGADKEEAAGEEDGEEEEGSPTKTATGRARRGRGGRGAASGRARRGRKLAK